jgi:hypothetical protein
MRTEEASVGQRGGLEASLGSVRVAIGSGFLAGLLVAGVGGRIAMLILRLTSSPTLHGLETDDGFTIGRVSGETGFLLTLTAVIGAIGGLAYLAVRAWVPARWRPAVSGLAAGAIGGASILRPDGLDFVLLEPLPLAVAMFVAIPAAFGVVVSVRIERRLRRGRVPSGWALWLPLLLFVLAIGATGPTSIAILAAAALAWALSLRVPAVGAVLATPPAIWAGRALLAGVVGASLVTLVADAAEIL